jgi:hypothetical protein
MNATKYDARDYQGKFVEVWGVESESKPGKIYTVAVHKDGSYSCGCPRWTMNRMRPECKHIKHVKYLRERKGASAVKFVEAPMPEQVKKKLSTFAVIEI